MLLGRHIHCSSLLIEGLWRNGRPTQVWRRRNPARKTLVLRSVLLVLFSFSCEIISSLLISLGVVFKNISVSRLTGDIYRISWLILFFIKISRYRAIFYFDSWNTCRNCKVLFVKIFICFHFGENNREEFRKTIKQRSPANKSVSAVSFVTLIGVSTTIYLNKLFSSVSFFLFELSFLVMFFSPYFVLAK